MYVRTVLLMLMWDELIAIKLALFRQDYAPKHYDRMLEDKSFSSKWL